MFLLPSICVARILHIAAVAFGGKRFKSLGIQPNTRNDSLTLPQAPTFGNCLGLTNSYLLSPWVFSDFTLKYQKKGVTSLSTFFTYLPFTNKSTKYFNTNDVFTAKITIALREML